MIAQAGINNLQKVQKLFMTAADIALESYSASVSRELMKRVVKRYECYFFRSIAVTDILFLLYLASQRR